MVERTSHPEHHTVILLLASIVMDMLKWVMLRIPRSGRSLGHGEQERDKNSTESHNPAEHSD